MTSGSKRLELDRHAEWRRNRCKLFHVYYLPEEHYIGVTNDLPSRMSRHRRKYNRHTDNMELLASFERRVDAAWFEVMLHQRGYNGFNNYQ